MKSASNSLKARSDGDDSLLDQSIEKYLHYKAELEEIEKKLEKYKKNIKNVMNRKNEVKYISPVGNVSITKANRSFLNRKDLPENQKEIWDKYSKSTSYEVLSVKRRK